MKILNFIKSFHFHKWEIVKYSTYDIIGIAEHPTIRECTKCGLQQELTVDCLGLSPLDYSFHWQEIKNKPSCFKSNPSYQEQAENCCYDCIFRNECFK